MKRAVQSVVRSVARRIGRVAVHKLGKDLFRAQMVQRATEVGFRNFVIISKKDVAALRTEIVKSRRSNTLSVRGVKPFVNFFGDNQV